MEAATDILNDCKTSDDVSQKLYLLEQLKEITLNKSPELLPQLAPGIFNIAIEKATQVRRFLISYSGLAISKNTVVISSIIPMFFHLRHDGNDTIIRDLCLSLATVYDKMAIYIANLPVSETVKAKDLWEQLSNISTYMIGMCMYIYICIYIYMYIYIYI